MGRSNRRILFLLQQPPPQPRSSLGLSSGCVSVLELPPSAAAQAGSRCGRAVPGSARRSACAGREVDGAEPGADVQSMELREPQTLAMMAPVHSTAQLGIRRVHGATASTGAAASADAAVSADTAASVLASASAGPRPPPNYPSPSHQQQGTPTHACTPAGNIRDRRDRHRPIRIIHPQ